jgi:hypothetical protein
MHINTNLSKTAHTFKVIAYYISNNNNTKTITDFRLSWLLIIYVESVLGLLHGIGMVKVVDIFEGTWRQHVLPKSWKHSSHPHGVTTQEVNQCQCQNWQKLFCSENKTH